MINLSKDGIKYTTVKVPSTFSPEQRPIFYTPVAQVSHKVKDIAYARLRSEISAICRNNRSSSILVHTVSYGLSEFLSRDLGSETSRIISYTRPNDRQQAIDKFLYDESRILVASSLDRGIDLPYDTCRVIIVCKIPFPNLADKQTNARLYRSRSGQNWYTVKTIRSLIQMTGRGMRSKDDYCESYILDKNFLDIIWKKNKHLLPIWWKEAIRWDKRALTKQ